MEFVTQKGQLRFDVEVRKQPEIVKVKRLVDGKQTIKVVYGNEEITVTVPKYSEKKTVHVVDTYVNIYRVVDTTKKGNERREVEPVATGVALQNPHDKFDKWFGKAVAFSRAMDQLSMLISKEDRGIIWDWFVDKFGGHRFLGNILPQKG